MGKRNKAWKHHCFFLIELMTSQPPLKARQVNISTEEELKFMKIGDYRDGATVDKVAKLLHKYQDLFPTKFLDLKGTLRDLGIMRTTLKLDAKPVKERPYRLKPKYKEKVRQSWIKLYR